MHRNSHGPRTDRTPLAIPNQHDINTLMGASLSPSTIRAYRGHCQRFERWCESCGIPSYPASPESVAGYISHLIKAGRKVATIEQAVAALAFTCSLDGRPGVTQSLPVKRTLAGARRVMGVAPCRKSPATAPIILRMLNAIPGHSLKATRDRALLALGFAGAFRRSELIALTLSDIEEKPEGALITVRRSKTDQHAEGQTIGILTGQTIKPLEHVREWIQAAGLKEGPIFRRINRHGHILGPLSDKSVSRIVKNAALKIGLDPADFSGHSLRAGFITSGAEAGSDALRIAEVSRHKNIDILRGYIRRPSLLRQHSGASFL